MTTDFRLPDGATGTIPANFFAVTAPTGGNAVQQAIGIVDTTTAIYDNAFGGTDVVTCQAGGAATNIQFGLDLGTGAQLYQGTAYSAPDDGHAYRWLHDYIWPVFAGGFPSYCGDFVPFLQANLPPYPLASADFLAAQFGNQPLGIVDHFSWSIRLTPGAGANSAVLLQYGGGSGVTVSVDGNGVTINGTLHPLAGLDDGTFHSVNIDSIGILTVDASVYDLPLLTGIAWQADAFLISAQAPGANQTWVRDVTVSFTSLDSYPVLPLADPCGSTAPIFHHMGPRAYAVHDVGGNVAFKNGLGVG